MIESHEPLPTDGWDLTPVEILFDFDSPEIFTLRLPDGEIGLAYLVWRDLAARREQFIICQISEAALTAFSSSAISVRDVFSTEHCWIVMATFSGQIESVHHMLVSSLPDDALPRVTLPKK